MTSHSNLPTTRVPAIPAPVAPPTTVADDLVKFITPELASELLAQNTRNRPVRWKHVNALAADIREGRWRLNGEAIKIGSNGVILDGQHRLHAIAASGTGVRSYLIENLDPDVFDTIDQGIRRSPADALTVDGESNAPHLSAACGVLSRMLAGTSLTTRSGKVRAREIVAAHPGLRASTTAIRGMKGCNKVYPSQGMAIALHYLFGRVDPNGRDGFFVSLVKGLGLTETDAVYHLRERLLAKGPNRAKLDTANDIATLSIRAWNARRNGQSISRLIPGRSPAHQQIQDFLKAAHIIP